MKYTFEKVTDLTAEGLVIDMINGEKFYSDIDTGECVVEYFWKKGAVRCKYANINNFECVHVVRDDITYYRKVELPWYDYIKESKVNKILGWHPDDSIAKESFKSLAKKGVVSKDVEIFRETNYKGGFNEDEELVSCSYGNRDIILPLKLIRDIYEICKSEGSKANIVNFIKAYERSKENKKD